MLDPPTQARRPLPFNLPSTINGRVLPRHPAPSSDQQQQSLGNPSRRSTHPQFPVYSCLPSPPATPTRPPTQKASPSASAAVTPHHLVGPEHIPQPSTVVRRSMAMDAAVAKKTGGGAGATGAAQAGTNGGGGERRSRFQRICVYCGSAKGRKPSYQDAAVELGKELVERGIDLVYGGGSIGLMGLVSHAVHDGGRHVIGVIPRSLMPREVTGEPVGEVRAVSGMHERKAEMARFADAFIALPGGYGTLEELLEVITWAQLGIHKKPVGLLNVDGFYDPLLSFIDMAVNEGFIKEDARRIIISAPTAKELVLKLEEYVPEYEVGLVWEDQMPAATAHGFAPELEPGIASS